MGVQIIKLPTEVSKLVVKVSAPIKKQLSIWVDLFAYHTPPVENEKTILIIEKFEAFKKWAKNEIESI